MNGITSYKDLENWDAVFPQKSYDLVGGNDIGRILDPSHGWYIMLLGNLHNETPALKLVLDNYLYLNRRTKDVRFFVPGFIVNRHGIMASNAIDHESKFNFNEDGFLETVEWLENGNADYEYSENMEMVLLPYSKESREAETVYDFAHMLHYNLDAMLSDEKNIIQFVTRAVRVVHNKMTFTETEKHMQVIGKRLNQFHSHKVFIAGAKSLSIERDAIRAEFSQLSNRGEILFQPWTFEDFDRYFTPEGRQSEYNSFIANQADSVIFVLDARIGDITYKEFDIALDTFKKKDRPKIHVYCHECTEDIINPEIQKIKDTINAIGQYYTTYNDVRDLKNQVLRDFYDLDRNSRNHKSVNPFANR